MAPYKRSNPTQLQKDREAIAKDQASRTAPKPNILQVIDRALKDKIARNRVRDQERAEGFGPPPILNGAKEMTPANSPEGAAMIGIQKRKRTTA